MRVLPKVLPKAGPKSDSCGDCSPRGRQHTGCVLSDLRRTLDQRVTERFPGDGHFLDLRVSDPFTTNLVCDVYHAKTLGCVTRTATELTFVYQSVATWLLLDFSATDKASVIREIFDVCTCRLDGHVDSNRNADERSARAYP